MSALDFQALMKSERKMFLLRQKTAGKVNSDYHHEKRSTLLPGDMDTTHDHHTITSKISDLTNIPATLVVDTSSSPVCISFPPGFDLQQYKIGSFSNLYYIMNIIDKSRQRQLLCHIDTAGTLGAWIQLKSRRLQCWGIRPPEAAARQRLPLHGDHQKKSRSKCYHITECSDESVNGQSWNEKVITNVSLNNGSGTEVTGNPLQIDEIVSSTDTTGLSSNSSKESQQTLPVDEELLPWWLQSLVKELVTQGVFPADMEPNNVLINQYSNSQGILHHTDGPRYHDRVAILSLGAACLFSFRPNLKAEEIGIKPAGDVFSILLHPGSLLVFDGELYSSFQHGIDKDSPGAQIMGQTCPCLNLPPNMGSANGVDYNGAGVAQGQRTSLTFRRIKQSL